jgi:hypothetical protein
LETATKDGKCHLLDKFEQRQPGAKKEKESFYDLKKKQWKTSEIYLQLLDKQQSQD